MGDTGVSVGGAGGPGTAHTTRSSVVNAAPADCVVNGGLRSNMDLSAISYIV
jgi:hypothetical protein